MIVLLLLAADWPQLLGPARSGVSTEVVRLTAKPAIVWRGEVGAGFAGPAIVDGKLILFHRLANEEVVEARDLKAGGKQVWRFGYPTRYRDDFGFDEGPRAVPTVAGGRVYTHGAEGTMHCLELATGRNVWSVDTRAVFGSVKQFFGAAGAPLVDNGRVILNAGGPGGKGIVALDAATGKTAWTATNDEAGYSSPVASALGILVFNRAGLVALDPAAGRVKWQFPWRSRSHASVNAALPVVDGNRVFVTASYGTGAALIEIGPAGPKTIWSNDDSLSSHYATPVLREGILYGFDGRQEMGQELRAVELATGKVRWKTAEFHAGSLILAGKTLLVMSESGDLVAAPAMPDGYNPAGRTKLLTGVVRAFPALSDGVFCARNEREMVCVGIR